jgi:predicted aldo/keto reductase-like oxidoreductase
MDEDPMRKVELGKSGLGVSELGFGGIPVTRLGEEEAVELIRHCFKRGVTFFDTARVYGDSEVKLGLALEPFRGEVVLATKTFHREAEAAARDVETSLLHLRTSRIDLYQLHQVANAETLEKVLASGGAYESLERFRREGKIGAIGFSSHNLPTAIRACKTGRFATVQFPFNFVETDAAEALFGVAREMGMGIIAMKPFGGGLLGRADLCFRFLQQHPDVVPIPGIQAREELDEILDLYGTVRPPAEAEWAEIRRIRSEIGNRFCHRCEYCMPCEKGVNIPGALVFRSQPKRFPPAMAIAFAAHGMKSVENCEECGECVRKCPYDLPIPELLRETLSLYQEFVKKHT